MFLDVVHAYCRKWRLKANVGKSAVMVFSRESVDGTWEWGEHLLPKVSQYTYFGIDFTSSGKWDVHIRRFWIMGYTLEYGSEVWEANKSQVWEANKSQLH